MVSEKPFNVFLFFIILLLVKTASVSSSVSSGVFIKCYPIYYPKNKKAPTKLAYVLDIQCGNNSGNNLY